MKVPIARIRHSPLKIHELIDKINLGNDATLIEPAILDGEMSIGIADEVHFKGHISASVLLTCVRCLSKFKQQFEIDFKETYIPKSLSVTDIREKELNKEDLDTFIYYSNYIDTSEIVRELLIERIPLYPLCPKCRALDNS